MAPAMEMSKKSIDEYTEKLRERYSRMTGRQTRGKILDEYIEVTGFERKYAIKVLGGTHRKTTVKSQRGNDIISCTNNNESFEPLLFPTQAPFKSAPRLIIPHGSDGTLPVLASDHMTSHVAHRQFLFKDEEPSRAS